MKKLIPVMLIAFMLCGCNEPKKIAPARFKALYNFSPESMHYTKYLGEKDGKVYVVKKSMSLLNQKKWDQEIFYVKMSELDAEFLAELRKKNLKFEPKE